MRTWFVIEQCLFHRMWRKIQLKIELNAWLFQVMESHFCHRFLVIVVLKELEKKSPEFNCFQSLLGCAWIFSCLIAYITYVSMLYFLPPQQIKGSVPLITQYIMIPKICLWSLLCCLHKSTYNSLEREIANLVPSWFSFLMISGVSPSKWHGSKKIRLVL